jgi:hypothetical protein
MHRKRVPALNISVLDDFNIQDVLVYDNLIQSLPNSSDSLYITISEVKSVFYQQWQN